MLGSNFFPPCCQERDVVGARVVPTLVSWRVVPTLVPGGTDVVLLPRVGQHAKAQSSDGFQQSYTSNS